MRSRKITSATTIKTNKSVLYGVLLMPDGTNACNVVCYDEADDSATAAKQVASVRASATESRDVMFEKPLILTSGLHVTITGTGAIAFIYT